MAAVSGRVPLGLASLTGMAVTGYILVWKYSSAAPTFCGSAACADVLRGPYSELFGVSIAVPAFAAYSLLLLLTLALPALQPRPDAPGSAPEAQPPSTLPAEAIVTLSTAMACSSAYLVSLLSFGLRELCPLCLTSAASAVVACAAAWTEGGAAEGVPVPARRRAVRVAVAAALVFSSVHFYVGSNAAARYQPAVDGPQSPPPITRHSSEQALDIAARLERLGAHMYGAYWCSHCYDQKQTLGVEGFAKVDYIECDPNGVNSRRSQCKARGITGYPTWEIGDKLLAGEKSLMELDYILEAAESNGDVEAAADEAFQKLASSSFFD